MGEQLDLTTMVDDVELACEARRHVGDRPARWVLWQIRCCPARPPFGLVCSPCLTRLITCTTPSTCRDCGTAVTSGRARVTGFERLDKPPAAA